MTKNVSNRLIKAKVNEQKKNGNLQPIKMHVIDPSNASQQLKIAGHPLKKFKSLTKNMPVITKKKKLKITHQRDATCDILLYV